MATKIRAAACFSLTMACATAEPASLPPATAANTSQNTGTRDSIADSAIAVLRSSERDPARPHVAREWDGRWQWNSSRGEEPRAALYGFMFPPNNPHVNALEFFNYPNQALTSRHDVVAELTKNRMPPAKTSPRWAIARSRSKFGQSTSATLSG